MEPTEKPAAPTSTTIHAPTLRSLVRKLASIMGEVERVPKSGRNEFHKYDYVTEADISAAVRKGMAERGLMLIPSVEKTEWSELPTRNGKMRLCTLTVRFTIEDGDSGETREMVVIGEGTDQTDKASYKAMTGAEKYALLKLFMIPTGDDPEKDDPRPPAEHHQPAPKSSPPLSAQVAPKPAAQAAAPKAEAPKAEPKKDDKPKQAPALRNRAVRFWKNAQNAGATAETFQAWTTKVLGRAASSADWDAADMDRLEGVKPPDWFAEIAALERAKSAPAAASAPPPPPGPDPSDVPF